MDKLDSVKLELMATEHVRVKDNEYLLAKIAERDKLLREWMSYARDLKSDGHLDSLFNRTKSTVGPPPRARRAKAASRRSR